MSSFVSDTKYIDWLSVFPLLSWYHRVSVQYGWIDRTKGNVFCSKCAQIPRVYLSQPITRRQILDWSKLKQSADDNFKFDENIRTFYKWVENAVGKGEIACYEQFLLFPQCFQNACFPGASKGVIVWECVKQSIQIGYLFLHHYHSITESQSRRAGSTGQKKMTSFQVVNWDQSLEFLCPLHQIYRLVSVITP